MFRDVFMTMGLMCHAHVTKTGAPPSKGQVAAYFDAATEVAREAARRLPELERIETEAREAVEKVREADRKARSDRIDAIVSTCVREHNVQTRTRVPPRQTGRGNDVCPECYDKLEEALR